MSCLQCSCYLLGEGQPMQSWQVFGTFRSCIYLCMHSFCCQLRCTSNVAQVVLCIVSYLFVANSCVLRFVKEMCVSVGSCFVGWLVVWSTSQN